MKISPRLHAPDPKGVIRAIPLLPVPLRLVAHNVRDNAASSWNRRLRNWIQS